MGSGSGCPGVAHVGVAACRCSCSAAACRNVELNCVPTFINWPHGRFNQLRHPQSSSLCLRGSTGGDLPRVTAQGSVAWHGRGRRVGARKRDTCPPPPGCKGHEVRVQDHVFASPWVEFVLPVPCLVLQHPTVRSAPVHGVVVHSSSTAADPCANISSANWHNNGSRYTYAFATGTYQVQGPQSCTQFSRWHTYLFPPARTDAEA